MMGVLEDILANKEEIVIKLLSVLEGKETKVRVNLDGIKFSVGQANVHMNGEVELTLVPPKEKK